MSSLHRRKAALGDRSPANEPAGISSATVTIFALACGAIVANVYYAQSLIGLIGPDLGLHESMTGLIVTVTQLGFGAGLMFLVSLADLMENRRLILLTSTGVLAGVVGIACSRSAPLFMLSSFLVGCCAVCAQIIVPLAAHLAPDKTRGRVIGNVMGGLLAGIMLARPLSSLVAASFGWRAIFWVSAVIMLALIALLWRTLPRRQPLPGTHYGRILSSTLELLLTQPALQRRAAYQGILFAIFSLFWTAAPLMLRDDFGLTQRGIALFALVGAGGALAAPLAGRLADRGFTRPATGLAILCVAVSFLISDWAVAAGLILVVAAAGFALDGAAQISQVLSQRVIYSLAPDARGRINAAFMTVIFSCGAVGSAIAPLTYYLGGWHLTALVAVGLGLVLLLLYATEFRKSAR